MVFDSESESLLVEFVCLYLLLSGGYHTLDGLAILWVDWGSELSLVMFGFLSLVLGILLLVSSSGLLLRGGPDWLVGAASTAIFVVLIDILGLIMRGTLPLALDVAVLLLVLFVLVRHRSGATSARSGMDEDGNVHSVGRDYP